MVYKSILILILTGIVPFHPVCQTKAQSSYLTITSKTIDVNHKGKIDTVKIVLNSGKLLRDDEKWCGAGLRYEGDFDIIVHLDDKRKLFSLNKLMQPISTYYTLWFRASSYNKFPKQPNSWDIQFDDYNEDSQPDFTLGQYAGCNGWNYLLFTIDNSGNVHPIDFECECQKQLFVNRQENSIKLDKVPKGFAITYYNNTKGRYKDTYRWFEFKGKFSLETRQKIK